MTEVNELLALLEETGEGLPEPTQPISKRGKGFPSERHVKMTSGKTRHGEPFQERLGADDPCPCGSGKKFRSCHREKGPWKRGDDYSRE